MGILNAQVILIWGAITFYVAATCLYLVGIIFKKDKLVNWAGIVGIVGYIPQTAAIILRWIETGHYPYWGTYEVYSNYSWALVSIFIVCKLLNRRLSIAGLVIFPLAFFMAGMALTGSKEIQDIPGTYLTYWLGIHIFFAQMAYGSGLIAAVFGLFYLGRSKDKSASAGEHQPKWLPKPKVADEYSYRFTILSFICMSIMIGSGAVWGYKAWGRYWGWDPIETWSLVCWFIYGIILHLRTTMGWRGSKAAWVTIAAFVLIIFAYFVTPILYGTVHEHLEVGLLVYKGVA